MKASLRLIELQTRAPAQPPQTGEPETFSTLNPEGDITHALQNALTAPALHKSGEIYRKRLGLNRQGRCRHRQVDALSVQLRRPAGPRDSRLRRVVGDLRHQWGGERHMFTGANLQ